jgi:ABC-type transport system substrate-binding protein
MRIPPVAAAGFLPPEASIKPLKHDADFQDPANQYTSADHDQNQIIAYYDFTGIKFHDGEQVDVMDIIFSYHMMALHPIWHSSVTPLMDEGGLIGNYSSERWLWVWEVDDGDINPLTSAVRIHLTTNYARLWTDTLGIPIFPRHVWEDEGKLRLSGGTYRTPLHADFGRAIDPNNHGLGVNDVRNPGWKKFDMRTEALVWEPKQDEIIGNGPFKFKEYIQGSHSELETYLEYYPSRAYIDGIMFIRYSTPLNAVNALKAGDIDVIAGYFPPDFIPDISTDPNIAMITSKDPYFSYVGFNMRSSKFGYPGWDPANGDTGRYLRKAIAHLIDKKTIVDYYTQGYGIIADGPVSPLNTFWYNGSLPSYDFDVNTAKAILDANGYVDGADGDAWRDLDPSVPGEQDNEVELLALTADFDPVLAQSCILIETELRDAGINVRCNHQSFGTIINNIDARTFEMYMLNWDDSIMDPWNLDTWADPDYMFDMFYGSNGIYGRNYFGYKDSVFDQAIIDSRMEMNLTKRQEIIKYCQGIIADDLPLNPLHYKTSIWAYRNDRFINWTLQNSLLNYWSYIGINLAEKESPTIYNLQPPEGSTTNNSTPTISANYSDESGINISSVVLRIDGNDVTSLATINQSIVVYTPPSALTNGSHEVYIFVRDMVGNTATRTWSFTIDTEWIDITKIDSDNDGLSDYDEIFIYGTDPENPDTDGDGINDGDEIARGTNPLFKDDFLTNYWWVLLIFPVIIIFVGVYFIMRKKGKPEKQVENADTEESVEEIKEDEKE